MKKTHIKIKELTFLALCTAAALILSYIESLIPPITSLVPGIKMGLPNIAVIYVLYRFDFTKAAYVSFLRVFIIMLLFGTPVTLAYSAAGAFLSLFVMALLKKLNFLSPVGVSVAGGISHNLGQILMAIFLLGTAELGYYMIILALTGTISGIFVGLCGSFILKRISHL